MDKILFDPLCAQQYGDIKHHGGGEYTKTIFEGFVRKCPSARITVCLNDKSLLDDWMANLLCEHRSDVKIIRRRGDIYALPNSGDSLAGH